MRVNHSGANTKQEQMHVVLMGHEMCLHCVETHADAASN